MALFTNRNRNENPQAEMSFIQHLDALRWHLVRSAGVIVFCCVVFLIFSDFLFDRIIFAPRSQNFPTYSVLCRLGKTFHLEESICIQVPQKKLQTLGAGEQFSTYLWTCLVAGLITGFPYLLWEIWKFIRPALKSNEAKPVRGFVLFGSFLFASGILFGYFLLFPLSYNFLITFRISEGAFVETNNTLDDYISLLSTMTLVTGIVFELPIVVYFLTRLGIFSPGFMRKYRRHAVVIILIVSAIITPSPDVMSQLIVFTPLYFLYEISIFVSAYVVRQKTKASR